MGKEGLGLRWVWRVRVCGFGHKGTGSGESGHGGYGSDALGLEGLCLDGLGLTVWRVWVRGGPWSDGPGQDGLGLQGLDLDGLGLEMSRNV